MPEPELILRTAVGVGVLIAIATALLVAARIPERFTPLVAVARGAAQLAAISFVLTGVIRQAGWVAVALAVMFVVATTTSAHRLGGGRRRTAEVGAAMAAGIVTTLLVVFAGGAVQSEPRYLLALGGIVIGNSMSIATLAGRRFTESADEHWDEVEGWLALGATHREATRSLARRAVHSALIPSTDQTKTTGLVTLPGAFVGAIFGGLSPFEAGRFQIVVLAAIMCAGVITALILVALIAPVRIRPSLPTPRRTTIRGFLRR